MNPKEGAADLEASQKKNTMCSVLHMSLDLIEERLLASSPELYLGNLGPLEEYQVFAYLTHTQLKFIVLFSMELPSGQIPRPQVWKKSDMKFFFQHLHELYMKLLSNPFIKLGEPLLGGTTNSSFQHQLDQLISFGKP